MRKILLIPTLFLAISLSGCKSGTGYEEICQGYYLDTKNAPEYQIRDNYDFSAIRVFANYTRKYDDPRKQTKCMYKVEIFDFDITEPIDNTVYFYGEGFRLMYQFEVRDA